VRVLFISDVYFPRVNGVSTSIRTFREDLASHGVKTLLVVPRYGTKDEVEEPGVLRVPARWVPGDPEDRWMHWGALNRLLSQLPRADVDVVHIHTPFLAHYAGVRLAKHANLPSLATYHTFFEEYLHHYVPALSRRFGRLVARTFTRSQCAQVKALIAPSEPMRDILVGEYGITTPIHVVPTGLPADRFAPGDGARFRAQAGIPLDRPLLTYIGRVAHEKNIDFLVDVLLTVRRSMPRAMLLIAGQGPALEPLRQRVLAQHLEQDVYFAGYLDRKTALLDCYAAANVFIFASRTETQGLVLLEAMAQGVPIVSTAVLGTRSILKPGCGALVVDEDRDAFARAITRLLSDTGLQRELAERGRAYARNWSSAAMAGRLAELYESLSGVPRAQGVMA
jgi:glycosyltransferase involved in cell wall biosynthesis